MKTALVIGAGRGIGKVVAEYLLKDGYKTVAVSRTEKDLLALSEFGDVFPFVGDITSDIDRKRLGFFCHKIGVIPQVLVNNAGGYFPDDVLTDNSTIKDSLELNLVQVRQITALFWEDIKFSNNGYVFNIISVLGKSIRLDAASYTISKHALAAYNKLLFQEGKKHGIKVTGIFPESVYTSSWEGTDANPETLIAPEDIAKMIMACLSLSRAAVPEEIHLNGLFENS